LIACGVHASQAFVKLDISFIRFIEGAVNMRLDKYLKVSRLIKRRSVANEACDAGRVQINGRVAKAGTEVKVGDHLTIQFGNKDVSVEVLDVQETVHKENAGELYKYI
jgi:ribosomal 50S subunit-recycling heat shock protein